MSLVRAYSVPDLGTPVPQAPIGSSRDFGPSYKIENGRQSVVDFDTGSVSSYTSSRRSNYSISSVAASSSIFSPVPRRSYANYPAMEDVEMLEKKQRDRLAMLETLERMTKIEELEGQPLKGWETVNTRWMSLAARTR